MSDLPDNLTALKPLLVNAKTAAKLHEVSRSQWCALDAAGRVPRPIRALGIRCPRWRVAELEAWCDAGCPDRLTWERMKSGDQAHIRQAARQAPKPRAARRAGRNGSGKCELVRTTSAER